MNADLDALRVRAAGRIALFVPDLRGGGAERVMADLSKSLVTLGYQVDLVLSEAVGTYLSSIPSEVRVFDLGHPFLGFAVPGLVRYLRRERPAAILSTLKEANLVAIWAKALAKSPARLVIREANTLSREFASERDPKGRLKEWLVRRFYPLADAVVAVSGGVAGDLLETLSLDRNRVRVIYNPVSIDHLRRQAYSSPDHPWFAAGEPPVIVSMGRLAAQKDFGTLLRALARVRQHREVRLLILGEGPDRAALEREAAALGLADAVQFPGFMENPFSFLSRAALFVLSSRWEGLPNSLIQAMALGVPVVATDCPSGPREILEDGRLGRLVVVGDEAGLAAAIADALASPSDGVDRENSLQRFSEAWVVRQYLDMLFPTPARGGDTPG